MKTKTTPTPTTWTSAKLMMMERWWSPDNGKPNDIDREDEEVDAVDEQSEELLSPAETDDIDGSSSRVDTAVLKARVERARERERALFEKLRLARKARLEELRRERYHQSPEYKRWLKNREEKKEDARREKEALKRAAPFQTARWRMHDGKFHDLEDMPVVHSTRLAVATVAMAAAAAVDADADADAPGAGAGAGSSAGSEAEAAVEMEGVDNDVENQGAAGGGGGGGVNGVSGVSGVDGVSGFNGASVNRLREGLARVSQGRQHDSYLRRGGAAHGWVSAPPADFEGFFDLVIPSSDGVAPPARARDETSKDPTSAAKRWAALMKPKRPPRKTAATEDAQTLEATVVYGDDAGVDARGGGLDIEGIEGDEGAETHGRAHGVNPLHGGGARRGEGSGGGAPADAAPKDKDKNRARGDAAPVSVLVPISGGGSKDVRLGGDRWGVGVMGRVKGAPRGTATTAGLSSSSSSSSGSSGGGSGRGRGGGGSSMIRGRGGDVVQVGGAFKANGGRNKYVYQSGFEFANLTPGGRSV